MSLIEEALRKTQKVTQGNRVAPQPKTEASRTPQTTKQILPQTTITNLDDNKMASVSTLALATIAVMSLSVALFSIQSNQGSSNSKSNDTASPQSLLTMGDEVSSQPKTVAPEATTIPQVAANKSPFTRTQKNSVLPKISETPKIQLNGVVVGGQVPYAIINGEIMVIGETVEDASIINITQDYVSLQYDDGSKTRLYVKSRSQ